MYIHRLLVQPTDKNYLNAMWGKLACEILTQNWEEALKDFGNLRDYIDGSSFSSSLERLQQMTWLIHWSLFLFFNHPKVKCLIYMFIKYYLTRSAFFSGA